MLLNVTVFVFGLKQHHYYEFICDYCLTIYVKQSHNRQFEKTFCNKVCKSMFRRGIPSKQIISIDEIRKRIYQHHGNKVVLDETTYNCAGRKARFLDLEYGEFWASPGAVAQGGHHPKHKNRIMRENNTRRLSIEVVEQRLKEIISFNRSC